VNNTVYVIITLLKAALIIIGMVYSFLNFKSWLKTKDRGKLKKAIVLFGMVILSIIVLTGIEFIIALS